MTGTSKSKLVAGHAPCVGLGAAGAPLLAVDELMCLVLSSGGFLDCGKAKPLRNDPRGGDGGGYDTPLCPGLSRPPWCCDVELDLPEGGTSSSDDGGLGLVEWLLLGEVARFRFGSDCPRLENTGTCTLRVFGDGDLDSRLRLLNK